MQVFYSFVLIICQLLSKLCNRCFNILLRGCLHEHNTAVYGVTVHKNMERVSIEAITLPRKVIDSFEELQK